MRTILEDGVSLCGRLNQHEWLCVGRHGTESLSSWQAVTMPKAV
jgi:hypothetical protein